MLFADVITALVMTFFMGLFALDSGPGRAVLYAMARRRRSRHSKIRR
jgi:hypothetical protein